MANQKQGAGAFDLAAYLSARGMLVDSALDEAMPPADARPGILHEAMRYAAFTGGKRLRPILCMAAADIVCGSPDPARYPALAVEVLHTYTLVHDDLPGMDNDALRRGRPTVHVRFGEAHAILTGDALQTLAFELLARAPAVPRWSQGRFVTELARAAGSEGVVGGQVEDIGGAVDAETIRRIHLRKTAGLFRAALRLGAMSANGTVTEVETLGAYGLALGMAFQIADDLLDADASHKTGAPAETTCLSVCGPDEARALARRHVDDALSAIAAMPADSALPLRAIADYVVDRNR